MTSILSGIALMVVISVAAAFVLETQSQSSGDAYSSSYGSVRIGE